MGCWNKTCALSNLPITYGDDTYVFVIEKNTGYGADKGVYAHHMFLPCLLPFQAKYNDYGAGEDNKGIALDFIIPALKEHLIEVEQGENKYHDTSVKREGFDIDKFYAAVHEQRLQVKSWNGARNVSFVMMRKDVVDEILSKQVYERYIGGDEYLKYSFEDVVNSVDDLIKKSRARLEEHQDDDEKTRMRKSILRYHADMWLRDFSDNLAGYWLRLKFSGSESQSSFLNVGAQYADLIAEDNFKDAKVLIVKYLKGIAVDSFMEVTRRSWCPTSGEGSQDEALEEHALLANVTLSTIKKIEKGRED